MTLLLALLLAGGIQIEIPDLSGPSKPSAAAEGLICRRDLDIGSLIKTTCRCATKEQWQRASTAADIYATAGEQRERIYFSAAECDAPRGRRAGGR